MVCVIHIAVTRSCICTREIRVDAFTCTERLQNEKRLVIYIGTRNCSWRRKNNTLIVYTEDMGVQIKINYI